MINQLKIKIIGKNPNTFLNELINDGINIYELEKKDKDLIIRIDYSDYQKILDKKTIYKIKIIKKYGISRIKELMKKYYIFIILWITGFLINYLLGMIIWKVEVINSNQSLVKIVKKDLQKLGIAPYHRKVSFSEKEIIKKKLLGKERELIEWIEIEEKGSKYIVKVEQRKKKKEEKQCKPRNIVSQKNAIIIEIKAKEGEIIKKKNDYVEKGETIISGWIHNKEDVIAKKCAEGIIYGEVWYKVKVNVPLEKKIITKTGKKKKGITIVFFNEKYNLWHKFRTYQKKEYNIIEEKFIPIKIGFSTYYETNLTNEEYTIKEIDNQALKMTEKAIKKRLRRGEKILEKKVLKKTKNNSKIEVEVFCKIKENITGYQDISKIPIEEMNKKEE